MDAIDSILESGPAIYMGLRCPANAAFSRLLGPTPSSGRRAYDGSAPRPADVPSEMESRPPQLPASVAI